MFSGCQQFKAAQEIFIDAHDGTKVIKFTAIVWRRKHGDKCAIVEELVSVLNDHVCSANQIQVVLRQEFIDDTLSETV